MLPSNYAKKTWESLKSGRSSSAACIHLHMRGFFHIATPHYLQFDKIFPHFITWLQGYSISNGYALSNKWLYRICNRIYYTAQNITKKSESNHRLPNYVIMYVQCTYLLMSRNMGTSKVHVIFKLIKNLFESILSFLYYFGLLGFTS